MTDNAWAYRRGRAWRQALTDLDAQARFTRRYRPQTNGKAERFNRTLADEWAYAQPFTSNQQRADALPVWLHTYNYHRSHTSLGGKPPISRLNNAAGHYN
jgi:transposase InsO family protein